MPKTFPSRTYYHCVRDITIPSEMGSDENIILTMKGMEELAQYYKEKYGIEIIPFSAAMAPGTETGADVLCELIQRKRLGILDQSSYRCGFIFYNHMAGEHGHAMPIIWEKHGEEENLFFLDSGQILGNVSYEEDERDRDLIFKPELTEETALSDLEGASPTAYVLCQDGVLFVDKMNNECINLSIQGGVNDDDMCMAIYGLTQKRVEDERSSLPLSAQELKTIARITHYDINRHSREPKQFRDKIKEHMPDIQIWSQVGSRQIDLSSCTTDAMVTLKDGLREGPTLRELAGEKEIGQQRGVHLFRMPERLLKTSQIASYVSRDSGAEMSKIVHSHHEKDSFGRRTGVNRDVTLREFRDSYEVPVSVRGETKYFGTYTIKKGEKIAEILRARWEEKQLVDRAETGDSSLLPLAERLIASHHPTPSPSSIRAQSVIKASVQDLREGTAPPDEAKVANIAKITTLIKKLEGEAAGSCLFNYNKGRKNDKITALQTLLENYDKKGKTLKEAVDIAKGTRGVIDGEWSTRTADLLNELSPDNPSTYTPK